MKKIKGVIDRFEGQGAFLKSNGNELMIPKKLISGEVGDSVVITFSTEEEDLKGSQEIAEKLLTKALKGE